MTFRDLLKKKNNDDNSQSTSSVESSSATLDDTQSKNKTMRSTLGMSDRTNNKSMLDYLRTQEAVGQEEEEQNDTAQASAGVDIMSRYYNSSQLANKNAQNEMSKSTFDSMKNKLDNITKYYNGSNKLSDDMVSAYKTLSDNGYKSLDEVEENILNGDLPKDVTSAYSYITNNLNKISSTDQQSTDTLKTLAKQYVAKHGYTEDTEDYQGYIQNAEDVENYYKNSAKEIQDEMSDFNTEEEYNLAVAQAKEDAKTSDDLQAEYDKLKKQLDAENNKSYDKDSYSDSEIAEYYQNMYNADSNGEYTDKSGEPLSDRLKTLNAKIKEKKELEAEEKYYKQLQENHPEIAKTFDSYYNLQSEEKDDLDPSTQERLQYENLANKAGVLDSDKMTHRYTYDEAQAIRDSYNNLKPFDNTDIDTAYKYYKRAKDREKAEAESKKNAEFAKSDPVSATIFSVATAIPASFQTAGQQMTVVADKLSGGDGYFNPQTTQVYQNNLMTSTVAENIDNPFWQTVYSQGVSLADNAIRIGIGYANPIVGLSVMGAEVATQAFNDTIENGGSVEQALLTGLVNVGVEVLTEKISLGNLKALKKGGVKGFKNILKNTGKQILTEASEEVSATLLDTVADEMINGKLSQLEVEYDKYIDSGMSEQEAGQAVMVNYGGQIFQDALGGALMGAISGGIVNTAQYRSNKSAGKTISSLGNTDTVKNIAKHYGLEESVKDYESKPTNVKLGSMRNEIIEKATSEAPTEKEVKTLFKNNNLSDNEKTIARKLINNEELDNNDLEEINKSESLKNVVASDIVNRAKTSNLNGYTAMLTTGTKLVNPSLLEVTPTVKSENEQKLSNTEILNKDLAENAKSMTVGKDTIDNMKESYKGLENKIDPEIYMLEYARYYNQGVRAIEFNKTNSTTSQLPYNVQISAYEDGLSKYKTVLKANSVLSNAQAQWENKTNGYSKGTVDTSALDGVELNEEQVASKNYISKFADFGLNINLYASQADENGNFPVKNGDYNSATNTLSIDLNAKRTNIEQTLKQGAVMSVFGHELTHIAENAPKEYSELTKAIQEAVGADNFNKAVDKHREYLDEYNSKDWQNMSEDEKEISATTEAVAEFASDLVNQAKILEKMTAEKPSVAQKFINAIKKVISQIKKLVGKDRGKTEEALLLESASNDLQSIVDKYEKAVIQGIKNQNAKANAENSSTETKNNSVKENTSVVKNNITNDNFFTDDDLFDDNYSDSEDKHIDFSKKVDENNPELSVEQVYNHAAFNVKEGLVAGKGIKLDDNKIKNIVKSVMKNYNIDFNSEGDYVVNDYVNALNELIDSVQHNKSNFTEAFENFVMQCKKSLKYSTQLDEQHEEWAKEIRKELYGTTLLIPDSAVDTIKENYGSVGKYRKLLFGKVNVKLERNAKGITGSAGGEYIEDVGSHLEEIGGKTLMIEDGFDWDSDSGYRMLDKILNQTLAPQYVNTYDGKIQTESSIDSAAIQMAFDTTAEYLKQQGKAAVTRNGIKKKKINDISNAFKKAQETKEAIHINLNKGDFISTREAFARAIDATTINKSEQNVVKSYREELQKMSQLNDKANELADKIKVIRAKDKLTKDDKVQIESLRKAKFELDDEIASKDKTLLKLESTEAMRSLLKHETAKKIARMREQKNERYNDMLKQKSAEKKEALAKQRENQQGNKNLNTIKKYAKKLQNMVMHPTDTDYVPYGLNEPIKQITGTLLNSMNLENGTELSEQLSKMSRKLKEVNKSDEHYGDFHNAYDEDLIEMIDAYADLLNDRLGDSKIQKKNSKNNGLTNSELADIAKIVKEIYTATKEATKQLGRNDVKTNYESGLKIIEQTKALGNVELNAMDTLLEQVLSPMRLMAKYTGYNENAELMYHINALNEGTQRYNMFRMVAEKPLNEYIKANPKEYEEFKFTPVEFEYNDRKGQKQKVVMTKSQALQILMSYERERQSGGKMEHIMRGGVTIFDAEQIKKGNYAKAFEQRKTITGITASFLISLEKKMGDFENGYRKLAENLFEVSKKYINDTSAVLKHRDIATDNYYVPFSVNREFLNTEIDGLKYDATIANKGMLHDTKIHAPQAINIAGLDSVINKHIRDVGQYYGYAIPIRNFNKALNMKIYEKDSNGKSIQTDSVRTALRTTFNSDKPITFIEQTLKDLQTSRTPLNGTEKTINKVIKAIRNNMITSALTGSVSVVIKQGASLYTASSILSFSSVSVGMAKGIRQITHKGGWKSLTDEIDAHTAGHYMRRIGLSSMEIEEIANSWLGKKLPTALNPTKWIQGTDCITTALHWVACKEEISRQYKESGKADKIGSEEYFNEVTKVYDRVLEETQPMYDSLHRSEIQKNSNELLKSVFMFKTQPLQNTGIIYDAVMDYQANKGNENLRAEKKQKLAKAVSSQMVSAFTFVAMTFVASLALHKPERYKDENDEVTLASIIRRMGIDWLENGASILVPIGGSEIASYIENQINGKDYDFASDNVVSMLNDFTSSIGDFNEKCIVALAKGEFDLNEATSAFWDLSVDALALFKGFPLKNYGNIVNGIFKNIGDAISGQNTYFGSEGGRKGSEYANSYDALIDNNPDKAKKQLDTFYNEKYEENINKGETTTNAKKKAQASVRTALTTQYKEEYQKAFLANDRKKMQEISQKLQKSGYMKFTNKTLSTVLNEWAKSAKKN